MFLRAVTSMYSSDKLSKERCDAEALSSEELNDPYQLLLLANVLLL